MNFFEKRRLSSSYDSIVTKSLPIQSGLQQDENSADTNSIRSFAVAYNSIEAIRRGVDLIVNLTSEIDFDVKDKLNATGRTSIRKNVLHKILNIVPSDDEDKSAFKRGLIMDYMLTGNAFIFFDGAHLFRLPSESITVHAGKKVKVSHYEYRTTGQKFKTDEIIHIKDNSACSGLIGTSRLLAARNSITTLFEMLAFQQNFFKNGAVPGLVLTTPNILGKKIKERLIDYWVRTYNPKTGGRRPLVLDGDFKVDTIATTNFKELDFEPSVSSHEDKILTAIGVPPILLKGGNNANIKPNMQLLYFTSVLPVAKKIRAGLESFFGFDLELDLSKIASLQPELQQQSSFQTSLVNAGIITVNEARAALRLELSDDPKADELIKPANIAGSAVDPSVGGKPPNEGNEGN